MPSPAITPDAVRLTLRAIRSGRPLKDSPLLVSAALQAAMRAARLTDSPAARATFLSRWLEQVVSEQIALARGNGGTPNGALLSPDSIPSSLSSEFQDGSPDGEAWALLHVYFFSGTSENQRQITARLPLGFNTVRRRLDRGYQLLADVLTEREREASAAVARGRSVPQPSTRFIGREAELGAIRQLMAAHRLVVLTGPGGVGKSRLAIRLARDLAADYPDDAWFVEIAALTDGRQVAQALMSTFGLREASGSSHTDTLAGFLADKRLLLVIDNCEHLAAACSALIVSLLERCPYLQVLATSRVQLQVHGAAHWSVPAMTIPVDVATATVSMLIHFDAPRLFGSRAAAAGPGFQLTDMNAVQVGGICARLDGLPLAIELAAARVPEMSLDQLETRLADRFALLKDGRHATRRSHETLQAMMDWSYDLLSEPEQWLLQRLAVFRGGWTLAAAEAVCSGEGVEAGGIEELLAKLNSKSLVQVADGEFGPRYKMLETVREYSQDRLEQAGEVSYRRDRHLAHFAEYVHGAKPLLEGPEQATWLRRLDIERANIQFALDWIIGRGYFEQGSHLASDLYAYWDIRGEWIEGRRVQSALLACDAAASPSPARERALLHAGQWALKLGDYPAAKVLLEETLALCRSLDLPADVSRILNSLAIIAELSEFDYDKARDLYERGLQASRDCGDQSMESASLLNLGDLLRNVGDFEAAASLVKAAIEIDRERGDEYRVATGLHALGNVYTEVGDQIKARACYQESADLSRIVGARGVLAMALYGLANAHVRDGDFRGAVVYFEECLVLQRDIGSPLGVARVLTYFGGVLVDLRRLSYARQVIEEALTLCASQTIVEDVIAFALSSASELAMALGHYQRAVRLSSASISLCEAIGKTDHIDGPSARKVLDPAAEALGDEARDQAYAEGRAMTTDQAIAYALGRMTWEEVAASAMGEAAAPDP